MGAVVEAVGDWLARDQVLAFSTLLDSPRVIACLLYPCTAENYENVSRRDALTARAQLRAGTRSVDLVIAAAPLNRPAGEIAERWICALQ